MNMPKRVWIEPVEGGNGRSGFWDCHEGGDGIPYVRADVADGLLAALRAVYPWLETSPEGEAATKRALAAIAAAEAEQ